jgi:DNA polymerase III alpha subunit
MSKISETIKDLIIEVFAECKFLSDDDLAFKLLDSIRVTTLDDLKADFNVAVRETMKNKLSNFKIKEALYSNRQLKASYVKKLTDKALELLSLKILNKDNLEGENAMGEFLYEGYPSIEVGCTEFDEIFLKENEGKKYWVTGKVVAKRVQKAKEDKYFAYLTLIDINGKSKLMILVPSEICQRQEEELKDVGGKSIGVTGKVQYNDFFKSNIIRAFEIEIPKGYMIERKPV